MVAPLARIRLIGNETLSALSLVAQTIHPSVGDRERLELLLIGAQAAYRLHDLSESAKFTARAIALQAQSGLLRPFGAISADERKALFANADVTLGSDELAALRTVDTPYPPTTTLVRLTRREMVIAAALSEATSRQEMADALCVSVNTVRKQLVVLYRKLGARTKSEALQRLEQLDLLAAPTRR
jgi:LuxR family maltose regulon positive regulatory protein